MPITKQTLAIIGSSSKIGTSLAKSLCQDNYRLLLFEEKRDEAESLSQEICSSVKGADVEFLTCKHLAGWEADIIVIANQSDSLQRISEEIKDVSTQKIVAITQNIKSRGNVKELELQFPNSKVVSISPSKSESEKLILRSKHEESLDIIEDLLAKAGYTDVKR